MRNFWLAVLSVAVLTPTILQADEKKAAKKEEKLTKHTIKVPQGEPLILNLPQDWKSQPPSNRLRLAQFDIPTAKGDTEKPQFVVSSMRGGGLEQNIPRWKSEFRGAPKMIVATGECPRGKYAIASLVGTHVGPRFRPRRTPLENGAVVTLVIMPDKGNYFYLKLTGPAKSVEPAAKALRKAIGADIKKEKKVENAK